MKKSLLAIALATAALSLGFSGQAIVKGKDLKAAQFNAVTEQGTKLNFQIKDVELGLKDPEKGMDVVAPLGGGGVWLNGLQWNGWSLNSIQRNGLRLNAVVLPDTSMQATKLQGMELQSLKVEGGQLVGVTGVAAE